MLMNKLFSFIAGFFGVNQFVIYVVLFVLGAGGLWTYKWNLQRVSYNNGWNSAIVKLQTLEAEKVDKSAKARAAVAKCFSDPVCLRAPDAETRSEP